MRTQAPDLSDRNTDDLPTGIIIDIPLSAVTSGFLICDGSAISRGKYSRLFGVIGTLYGSGDGSTTFNLPDLGGRSGVGYAPSGGHADVSTLGNNDGIVLAHRRPKHYHTAHNHYYGSDNSGNRNTSGSQNGPTSASNATTSSVDGGTGNANDPLDAPAYLVVLMAIKT